MTESRVKQTAERFDLRAAEQVKWREEDEADGRPMGSVTEGSITEHALRQLAAEKFIRFLPISANDDLVESKLDSLSEELVLTSRSQLPVVVYDLTGKQISISLGKIEEELSRLSRLEAALIATKSGIAQTLRQ